MFVCGVDDAGRGSLLGPLVIAGVSVQKKRVKELSSLGVKDSKKLTPTQRENLYKKIIEFADSYYVAKLYPNLIDRSVSKHRLNYLEARCMGRVISKLNPEVSYVDACDVNPQRFGREISKIYNKGKIKSYHHADSRFAIVSAASIIAKVTRDRSIARLQKQYDIGSGYPSDHKTIDFISGWILQGKEIPSFVRKSWKPVQIKLNFANTIA